MRAFRLGLALMAVGLSGCAGLSQKLEYGDTQKSLLIGYFDVEKSPCNLHWIEFEQVAPDVERPFFYMRIDQGVFYREDLSTPGAFQLTAFGGSGRGFLKGGTQYKIRFPAGQYGFSINRPGGVYFLGSYRIYEKGDFFASDTYLERVSHPTELEVLRMVLPNAVGTPWEPIIQNAIRAQGG